MNINIINITNQITNLTNKTITQPFPSLFLNTLNLTPFEISKLYTTFTNNKFRTPNKSIIIILNTTNTTLSHYTININQIFNPNHTTTMTQTLQITIQQNTKHSSPFSTTKITNKTKSSNNYQNN